MAAAIISSIRSMASKLVTTTFGSKTSSLSSDQVQRSMKRDLERLGRTLRRIHAVLNDAEKREIEDESVKLWLKELRCIASDAENVLEEYQYEVRRSEIFSIAGTSLKRKREVGQVDDLISILLHLSIPERIRDIMENFDEISEARKDLQLREEDGPRQQDFSSNPQLTTSFIDESDVFGREHDKEAVIQMLLSDESCKFSVLPIVGMGGLGKTTLAQFVYNDSRVCHYFDSRGWVCVSEDFSVDKLTREIIESITRQPCGLKQSDALQASLRKKVKGKRVLVVLDDVWNEKRSLWESLRGSLCSGGTVRIIVTSRNDSVAEIMQTMPSYRLGRLPGYQCWSLFCHRAFSGRDPKEYSNLVKIGIKIVRKCGGLPLAVKTLGGFLHYETDEQRWREVLESEMWDLDEAKEDILPALKLSYHRMPTHLKPCFLFSSVYPKDFRFKKKTLVKMWMAQGYILTQGNKKLEDIGSNYFDELHRRSFFLHAFSEEYMLHDIVHDLARSILKGEYHSIVLESDRKICSVPAEVRHLYVLCQPDTTLEQVPFENTRHLRTLIVNHADRHSLMTNELQFVHLGQLRVLEMKCRKLPDSIGNLKHLRYLNCEQYGDGLSSLANLYNMQTIYLTCGQKFLQLASIRHLTDLRSLFLYGIHFPIPYANLARTKIHNSGCLRGICYSSFSNLVEVMLIGIVGWDSLPPLGQLPSLRSLKIKAMDGVRYVGREFCCCYCLNNVNTPVGTDKAVFPCLEELEFDLMNLWEDWSGVRDGDFPCLRRLTIKNCPKLRKLSMLPFSLQYLYISNCHSLNSLFMEKKLANVGLPVAEELQFEDMPEWEEEWSGDFPCLRKLTITNCPKLRGLPVLPSSLNDVVIRNCWNLTSLAGMPNITSLERLELIRCPKLHVLPDEWFLCKPQHAKIVDCINLRGWCLRHRLECIQEISELDKLRICRSSLITRELGVDNLTSLKKVRLEVGDIHLPPDGLLPPTIQILEVNACYFLQSLPLHQNLSSLRRLDIWNCMHLTCVVGLQNLTSLTGLTIHNCPQLQLSPHEFLPSSLQFLKVTDCKGLKSLPLLHENLSSFGELQIFNCPALTIVMGLRNLSSLRTLIINRCPGLWLSPDEQLPTTLHRGFIVHCPALRGWCQQQSIPYNQWFYSGKQRQ